MVWGRPVFLTLWLPDHWNSSGIKKPPALFPELLHSARPTDHAPVLRGDTRVVVFLSRLRPVFFAQYGFLCKFGRVVSRSPWRRSCYSLVAGRRRAFLSAVAAYRVTAQRACVGDHGGSNISSYPGPAGDLCGPRDESPVDIWTLVVPI